MYSTVSNLQFQKFVTNGKEKTTKLHSQSKITEKKK